MSVIRSTVKNVGKLKNSMLLICDIQEKFRNNIQYFDAIANNSSRLLSAFKAVNLPVIATEQYPKGLGHTVAELDLAKHGIQAITKTQFSMCVPEVVEKIAKNECRSVVLCGIEGHVCVQQTALQLLEDGISVHIVADAVSSRSMTDRIVALQALRDCGAQITTTEAVVLGLAGGSKHPQFKALQQIIMTPSSDSGLLQYMKL